MPASYLQLFFSVFQEPWVHAPRFISHLFGGSAMRFRFNFVRCDASEGFGVNQCQSVMEAPDNKVGCTPP